MNTHLLFHESIQTNLLGILLHCVGPVLNEEIRGIPPSRRIQASSGRTLHDQYSWQVLKESATYPLVDGENTLSRPDRQDRY